MKFKFLKRLIIICSMVTGAYANAGLISKDYSAAADGLLTVDTIGQMEWLDVSIFYGMNLDALQGANQWTADRFHLATDVELISLFQNVGITLGLDGTGSLGFGLGLGHSTASIVAMQELHEKFGGGPMALPLIQGILADTNNDGLSNLGGLNAISSIAAVNLGLDIWGGGLLTNNVDFTVGAFFVRSVDVPETSTVPEPSTFAIFLLAMTGLASRKFKKQS